MMMSETILFCLLFSITQGSRTGDQKTDKCVKICLESWERNGDRCYLWQNDPKNWTEAEQFWNENEEHLASVTSQNIHNYIWSKIEPTGSSFWIGGSDQEEEGIWKWSDGSEWNFTHWLTNEPNNRYSNENCIQIGLFNFNFNSIYLNEKWLETWNAHNLYSWMCNCVI